MDMASIIYPNGRQNTGNNAFMLLTFSRVQRYVFHGESDGSHLIFFHEVGGCLIDFLKLFMYFCRVISRSYE